MTEERIVKLLSTENVYQVELGPGGRGITELLKEEDNSIVYVGIGMFTNLANAYAFKNDKLNGKEILNKKKFLKNDLFCLYFRNNDYAYTRIGILVTKKNGNAVIRNKIKRQKSLWCISI